MLREALPDGNQGGQGDVRVLERGASSYMLWTESVYDMYNLYSMIVYDMFLTYLRKLIIDIQGDIVASVIKDSCSLIPTTWCICFSSLGHLELSWDVDNMTIQMEVYCDPGSFVF